MTLLKAIRIKPVRINGTLYWRAEWWENRAGTWASRQSSVCRSAASVYRFLEGYTDFSWVRVVKRKEVML